MRNPRVISNRSSKMPSSCPSELPSSKPAFKFDGQEASEVEAYKQIKDQPRLARQLYEMLNMTILDPSSVSGHNLF